MVHHLFWEDLEIGTELTPLSKVATTQMLVRFAGASGDFNPAHYEDSFAKAANQNRAFVHGQLKRSWLVQLVVNWLGGDPGCLKKLSCRYRAVDWPRLMRTISEPQEGETWFCKGTVTNKVEDNGQHLVECDIWVENGKGEKTTTGIAIASLPSRAD